MAWTNIDIATGTIIYAASALGSCSKALVYDRLGVTAEPPPDWLQKAYDEGNDNEQRVIDLLELQKVWRVVDKARLLEAGYTFGEWMEDRQKDYSDQVRVNAAVLPGIVVRSHLDGVVEMAVRPEGWTREVDYVGVQRVLEVKAFGDSYWEKWKKEGIFGFPGYMYQVAAQMKGTGLGCVFAVGHKDKDGVVFEVGVEYIDVLPVKWLTVIQKIKAIEDVIGDRIENLPCEKPLMYPCPFYKLHEPDEIPMVEDDTERRLVISLAEEYERHRVAEKHHKDQKQRAGAAIAEFFDGRGEAGGKVRVGHWQVSDVSYVTEGPIDPNKLTEAFPGIDLSKYRKPSYTVRYPKVTGASATEKEGVDSAEPGAETEE